MIGVAAAAAGVYTAPTSKEGERDNSCTQRHPHTIDKRFFCARTLLNGREGGEYNTPQGGISPPSCV